MANKEIENGNFKVLFTTYEGRTSAGNNKYSYILQPLDNDDIGLIIRAFTKPNHRAENLKKGAEIYVEYSTKKGESWDIVVIEKWERI